MTPKRFVEISGLSLRACARAIGADPSAFNRWKSGKQKTPDWAIDKMEQVALDMMLKSGSYASLRLSELPERAKSVAFKECYESGASAASESECPYGADLGRRCAWMAGFHDKVTL